MSQDMIPNIMKITKTDYNCDKDQDSNISSKIVKRLKDWKKYHMASPDMVLNFVGVQRTNEFS